MFIWGNRCLKLPSPPSNPQRLRGSLHEIFRVKGLKGEPASNILTLKPLDCNLRATVAPQAPLPTTIAFILVNSLHTD